MFVHQHHLQHLLRPEHYTSPEHLDAEVARLVLPSWQLVCARSELPRDGDYLTLELFGRPVLVRNFGGIHHAFENVCCHRHCEILSAAQGNSPTLRCQYHGWEFDATGKTARIPDARCFKPWDRENSRIHKFRLESCGDLLFVALTDEAPSLRDWLSPHFEALATDFAAPEWDMRMVWEYDCDSNWKIPAENTIESYHVQQMHRKFFGDFYPPEENCEHTLEHRYTMLNYLSNTKMEERQAQVRRWLGGTPTMRYTHRHVHPHTVFVTSDTLNYALMYLPTSPTTVRIRMRLFAYAGFRRNPFARWLSWMAFRIGKKNTLLVHNEDRAVYPAQQRGLTASTHRGVIGTREERIYAFQTYILTALGLPFPAPPEATFTDEMTASVAAHPPMC